jgi:ferredoxin-type protein NapH
VRQKVRRIIIFIILLLFPVILNYLSPYVSVAGAFAGLISGSLALFLLLFVSGMFLGRAWCAWACPVAGIGEIGASVNNKPVNRKRLAVIRYSIFTVWFAFLVAGFVLAGGIRGFDPLYMTDSIVSVDAPGRYIIYYIVLAIVVGLTLAVGRRGACHAICWMSPFITGGELLGRALHLPQLKIKSRPDSCIDCGACTKQCPMSIDVQSEIKSGRVKALDCIRCGECVDRCPKDVLRYGMN